MMTIALIFDDHCRRLNVTIVKK